MLAALLGVFSLQAADVPAPVIRPTNPEYRKQLNLWKFSTAAVLASNSMDVTSSWGKRELNPVLAGSKGTFGGRGAVLKLGIMGGVVAVEYLVLRHRPSRSLAKAMAWINFSDAAVTGAVAGRNFGIAGR